MVAVDTNLIVRLLTRDDAELARRAARLMEKEEVWVAKTVILEAEWVLRSLYAFSREQTMDAFRRLFGLSTVVVEDEAEVELAMRWAVQGLDFADALHLASGRQCDRFVTFDENFIKQARKFSGVTMAQP